MTRKEAMAEAVRKAEKGDTFALAAMTDKMRRGRFEINGVPILFDHADTILFMQRCAPHLSAQDAEALLLDCDRTPLV